ncbi:MAG TPA: hypothetical protein VG013_39170 [Gemmataceae bacterium]|nr:hypothetical protein [Gemmataceae bacterium]
MAEYFKVFYHVGFFLCAVSHEPERLESGGMAVRRNDGASSPDDPTLAPAAPGELKFGVREPL